MHHVVLEVLGAEHEVPDEFGVRRHGNAERIFDRPHRSKSMNRGAHAARAFREGPCITGVSAFQDDLESPHHGAGTVRVDDLSVLDFRLNPEVAFDARNGVNNDASCHYLPPFCSVGSSLLLIPS